MISRQLAVTVYPRHLDYKEEQWQNTPCNSSDLMALAQNSEQEYTLAWSPVADGRQCPTLAKLPETFVEAYAFPSSTKKT